VDPVLPAWKTSGSTRCFGVRLRERLRGREGEEREPRRCRRGGRDRALAFARRSAAPSRFSSAPRRSCSRARLGARRRARRSLVALARRGRHCSRRSPAGALAPPHRSLLPLAPAPEAHTLLSHTNRSTCSLLGTQARPQSSPARPEQLDSPVRALSSFYRSRQCPLSLCYLLGRTEHGGGLAAVQRSHGPLALQLQLELFFSSPGCTPQSCACVLRRAAAAASAGRVHPVDERQALEMRTSGRSERLPSVVSLEEQSPAQTLSGSVCTLRRSQRSARC